MRINVGVVSVFMLLVPVLGAQEARKDVSGWHTTKWGMTESEVLAAFPGKAKAVKKAEPNEGVRFSIEIPEIEVGGRTFRARLGFSEKEGKLTRVVLPAKKQYWDDFAAMEKSLTAEFGPGVREDKDAAPDRGRTTVRWSLASTDVGLVYAGLRAPGTKEQGILALYYDQK